MKKVIVSVTNDLSTDQRVNRHCEALVDMGFDVLLVGRRLKTSLPLNDRRYQCVRMNLLFSKGPFFYMEYNFRLFLFLLFRRFDFLLSNDLDTLLPNFLVSRLKFKALVYDSHEFYTGVPELQSRPAVQRIWTRIEKFIFPKLKHVITVNQSIANLYKDLYGNAIHVVRNVPFKKVLSLVTKKEMGLPEGKKIILMQGAGINVDRGAEEIVEALRVLNSDQYVFLVVGSGDVIPALKEMVKRYKMEDKVIFTGKVPMEQLVRYTVLADVGVTMDKDTNVNYRFSLPNKLFDYIQCGVPVLASNLVEIRNIVEEYKVGEVVSNTEPSYLSKTISSFLNNERKLAEYKANALKAAEELCWEKEKIKFVHVITNVVKS
ncbi:MAG: glycosyltransferase [Bacteroidetes bacterium]|nr:glycosyltransferase [Bacteroidota bacterium]